MRARVNCRQKLSLDASTSPAGGRRPAEESKDIKTECEICGAGYYRSDTHTEWFDQEVGPFLSSINKDDEPLPLVAIAFEERSDCTVCSSYLVRQSGVGYWGTEAYEAEADAELLAYDGDLDTEGRQVVQVSDGHISPHDLRLVGGWIVEPQ